MFAGMPGSGGDDDSRQLGVCLRRCSPAVGHCAHLAISPFLKDDSTASNNKESSSIQTSLSGIFLVDFYVCLPPPDLLLNTFSSEDQLNATCTVLT